MIPVPVLVITGVFVSMWMVALIFAEIDWRIRKRRIQKRFDEAVRNLR